MECAGARWRFVLLGVLWTAGSGAGRARARLPAQENIFKLIQNIKDKLVVDNEDYSADEFSEGEFKFVIGQAKLEVGGNTDLAQFEFSIGHPVIEQVTKKAEPQRDIDRGTTRRNENVALRTRQVNNKHVPKASQSVSSTAGEVWDPKTPETEETEHVKLQSIREDVPAKRYSVATDRGDNWTPLHVMKVNQDIAAYSIVVPNFYPISQPEKRVDNKDRIISPTSRGLGATTQLGALRQVILPEDTTAYPEHVGGSVEQQSGFVTFKYKAKIPVEVPMSRNWIANAFGN